MDSTTSIGDERIALAEDYAKGLMAEHQTVDAVLLFGSVARGNALPVSHVDMYYVVPKQGGRLPIERWSTVDGIKLNVDAAYLDDLVPEQVLTDAFLFGLYRDAVVLADRTGAATAFIETLRKSDTEHLHRQRLAAMRAPVLRNLERYREGLRDMDHTEICRGSGFMMWCMAEYILCAHHQAPGGFRTLARLKVCNTDGFLRILEVQDSLHREREELEAFSGLACPLFPDQVAWMFGNGFKDEALHILWISLGGKVKQAKLNPTEDALQDARRASEEWVTRLGWDRDTLHAKADQMQALVDTYMKT